MSDVYLDFGLASERRKPRKHEHFRRHNEMELHYVEEGSISMLFSSSKYVIEQGRLAVFWGAIPHQLIELSSTAISHYLTVPLAWFLQWPLPGTFTSALLNGAFLIDSSPSDGNTDLVHFRRWHDDLGSPQFHRPVLLEVEARLYRLALALNLRKTPPTHIAPIHSSKVEQMAYFIARHYTQPLSVSQIAREVGLHPDYAVTLFRKTFGIGLVDYLTQHRLTHAQRLLAITDHKIARIAFESGFGSLSRFYHVFNRDSGQSPGQYRISIQEPLKDEISDK